MAYKSRLAQLEKIFNRSRFYEKLRKSTKIKPKIWTPDITISRSPGSGGRLVAKKVAKQLGWKFYNKKLLLKIAREMNLSEYLLADVDQRPRSLGVDLFHAFLNPNYISDEAYIKALKKIVLRVGRDDDVVFLGRGTNHIIPEDKALHVLITAPLEKRVKNTIKYEHLDREGAIRRITKSENDWHKFLEQHFGRSTHFTSNHDLIINTNNISLNQATQIIIYAYKKKFSKK